MAKLIIDNTISHKGSMRYRWWQILVIGLGMGVLYWVFTNLINKFIVEAIFCGSSFNADICTDAIAISGNLAGILVAIVGVILLVRIAAPRPLIVSTATFIILWNMSSWMNGLAWAETVAWEVLLFMTCYFLFSWISRYTRSGIVIALTVIAIVTLRILATL